MLESLFNWQMFSCEIWEIFNSTYFVEQSANGCFCSLLALFISVNSWINKFEQMLFWSIELQSLKSLNACWLLDDEIHWLCIFILPNLSYQIQKCISTMSDTIYDGVFMQTPCSWRLLTVFLHHICLKGSFLNMHLRIPIPVLR